MFSVQKRKQSRSTTRDMDSVFIDREVSGEWHKMEADWGKEKDLSKFAVLARN